ncbi:MAG: sigma-70 family RNA polymerase sigma factor [bacterium]
MELAQEYRALIENIIKRNPRFYGNEDLADDFCSETFKRCYSIISSLDNIKNFESYLNKVASSAILDVLKNHGRLRRSKDGYVQVQEVFTSAPGVYAVDDEENLLYDIPDPAVHVEEIIIQQEEIKKIKNIIFRIDSEKKNKKYQDIFILRYLKGLNQSEISSELGISQGEVSKRFAELVKKINEYME